jgi:hypothetical protein
MILLALSLFQSRAPPPVHVPAHQAAGDAADGSSQPTNKRPGEKEAFYFTSPSSSSRFSFSATPSTPLQPPATALERQLAIPRVIARCTAVPRKKTDGSRQILTNSPTEIRQSPLRPFTITAFFGNAEGFGQRYRRSLWNPLQFAALPSAFASPIKMLKDEATQRRATISTSTIPTPTNNGAIKTPSRKSVLAYFSSPQGKKYLDNLEKETLRKRREQAQQKNLTTGGSGDASDASDVHDVMLGREESGRLGEELTWKKVAGKSEHVACDSNLCNLCDQSPTQHQRRPADKSAVVAPSSRAPVDVFDANGE